MKSFKIDVTFVNRKQEMVEFRNYLEGRPNSILFCTAQSHQAKQP